MQPLLLKRIAIAAALVGASVAPAIAAKDGGDAAMPATLTMTFDGPVMVAPSGMTLYVHSAENVKAEKFRWMCTNVPVTTTNDQQSGIGERPNIGFKLIKSCLQKFSPYVADASAKPVGDFTIVDRPEGTKQWAYKNLPLYYSTRDRKPGDRNGAAAGGFGGGGRGRGGIAFASTQIQLPTGFKFSRQEDGLVLATSENDRAVYTPRGGSRVRLAGGLLGGAEFKPLSAPAIAAVSGEWGIINEAAGRKQYAFRGKPLYMAPAGVSDDDIRATGAWELVVVQKGPSLPSAVGKALTLTGDVYTDKKGMSLYTYNCNAGGVTCDESGDPAAFMVALCGDGKECARRWRPYMAAANAKPEGEFSILDITYPMFTDMRGGLYPADAPKVKVWAYRGKPLFTYYEDEKPGDMWGSSIGGIWGSTWGVLQVPGRSATQLEP